MAQQDVPMGSVLRDYTIALCAKPQIMGPNHAHHSDLLAIVTPLTVKNWKRLLNFCNIYHLFHDVPSSIEFGFDMGVSSQILSTYTPPNHKSAIDHPEIILQHISKELSCRQYSGPFSKSRLEYLIGPFRTSPLGTVPKSEPNEFRVIQDLSFPRNNPDHLSVNSEIDIGRFPCDWGSFTRVAEIVRNSPPGTQAAIMDVDSAFRCCPIKPSQQPHFVVQWEGSYYIDHCAPFGATSSGGVFGRLADTMASIIRYHTASECTNWVDDFVFFRSPILLPADHLDPLYHYDLSLVQQLADELGWPWKPSKTQPFDSNFCYLGFAWDLNAKTVHIPAKKRHKYIIKIEAWLARKSHSRKEVESILGTLVHCSLAIPDGRSRLPTLSRFTTSFDATKPFSRRVPNASTINDVIWWKKTLQMPNPGSSIKPPPLPSDTSIWVDASTSYGVGVVINHTWDAWKLAPGWDSHPSRKIGWAEMVALECGLRQLIHQGAYNTHLVVKSDNMGVIGALQGGKSRNSEQNTALQRITTLLRIHSLWISTTYTPSAKNLADPPSRGTPPADLARITDTFIVPDCLKSILIHEPVLHNP